jgi:hypothetical protein
LSRSIAARDPRFTDNLTLYRAWLAGTHAAARDLDGAAEAIHPTVDALSGHVTSRRAILDDVIATHHLIGRRDLPAMDTALARYEALRRA